MLIKVISESTDEPISLAQAIVNARAYSSAAESQAGSTLSRLITTARKLCEQELDMSLVQKTVEIAVPYFYYDGIELPRGPVRSVVSVTYTNEDGDDTVLPADQYRINAYSVPTLLQRAFDTGWPTDVRNDLESVRIRYTAGYPSTDSPPQTVPEPILQAMHLYISHYFDNRHAVDADDLMELPLGARHLLSFYRQGLGV